MLHYILQIIVFQLLFLLGYDLFLKRETFFNWNRCYLLGTALLSLVLPFIKLNTLKAVAPRDFVITLPEVIIGKLATPSVLDTQIALQAGIVVDQPKIPLWQMVLVVGMGLAFVFFLFKILKLYRLKYQNPKRWKGNVLIVKLLKSNMAFSFFNTIFLGEHIPKHEESTILKHELVHVEQRHSLDLLLFEILRIPLWFNPLVYMYQNRMKALHEYIADAKAVKQNGKSDYYQSLLNQVFETNNLSFTNTFFETSLIKKRISMLQKSKSKTSNLLKYALLIPLVFGMLFYISCEKEVINDLEAQAIDLEQYSYFTAIGATMAEEVKEVHTRYEEFLKSNSEYVSWVKVDSNNGTIKYSIHHKDEQVPEGYKEFEVSFVDGTMYKGYMNFPWYSEDSVKTETVELNPRDFDGKSEVPFSVIDQVPIFVECENTIGKIERKTCVSNTVAKFVNKNFNIELANTLGLVGRQKIHVLFKIDEQGQIKDVKARAPHPKLEEEAIRVVRQLPQLIPGKHNDKLVTVPYSLPIVFQIQS